LVSDAEMNTLTIGIRADITARYAVMLQHTCMYTARATISVGEDQQRRQLFNPIEFQPSSVSLNIELTILVTGQFVTAGFPFVDA
jgi:hypothetical protein